MTPLALPPLRVGAGMGGGFQLREMGRPMPLPSSTGTAGTPPALARCSAALSSSLKVLPVAWVAAGPPPNEPLLPLRPTEAEAPGDRRPAMMCGDSGAGATAGEGWRRQTSDGEGCFTCRCHCHAV